MKSPVYLSAIGILTLSTAASAQDFNISFGPAGQEPSPTYAAAGQPGVWNSVEAMHTSIGNPEFTYDLVDVDGNETDVFLHQFGAFELETVDNRNVTGDDAMLMRTYLVTFQSFLESCVYVVNLEPGTYQVITYAWMPDDPKSIAAVRHDFTEPTINVGGAWPGSHEENITYAVHIVEIGESGPTARLGSHSGIPSGFEPTVGAAMNGMQLRKLSPADLNTDGVVNQSDLGILLSAFGLNAGGDIDGNNMTDQSDLGILLAEFDTGR